MAIFKVFLTAIAVFTLAACSTTEIRDFARGVDPTGIAKIVTQSSVDEEKRIAREQQAELEKDKQLLREVEFKLKRDKWIGKNSDDLVLAWGKPSSIHDRNDGGKHFTFRTVHKTVMSGLFIKDERTTYYCNTTFITNKKGTILSWLTDGYCDDPTRKKK